MGNWLWHDNSIVGSVCYGIDNKNAYISIVKI